MPSRKSRRISSVRLRLWKRNPNCHWCGCETIWWTKSGKSPDNAATIDHLNSRYSPDRSKPCLSGERRRVLSCYKCNHDRNVEEQRNVPKQILRKLAGQGDRVFDDE